MASTVEGDIELETVEREFKADDDFPADEQETTPLLNTKSQTDSQAQQECSRNTADEKIDHQKDENTAEYDESGDGKAAPAPPSEDEIKRILKETIEEMNDEDKVNEIMKNH